MTEHPHDDGPQRHCRKGEVPHIGVIGAGMAGLRCAAVLSKKGMKVTIIEGRDRIGGRIHQSNHLGYLADLGPNWIHGTENNPIMNIAELTETARLEPPIDVPPLVFDENGKAVDGRTAQIHTGLVWETIEEANTYSKENCESIKPEASLLDYFKRRVVERGLEDKDATLVLQIARVWGDIVGEPIDKQSLKFFWLEECVGGGGLHAIGLSSLLTRSVAIENVFLAGTYKQILDFVAKAALADADLYLNTTVANVTSNGTAEGLPLVTLHTNNGSFTFDEVVITTPLGWLKRNLTAFDPPLSQRLLTSIHNLSYGHLEKVYMTFPNAFWIDSDSRRAFHTQFLSPIYASDSNPARWSIECVSLADLPAPHAHPTLLFYINGPCAAHVTSLLHPAAAQEPSSSPSPATNPKNHTPDTLRSTSTLSTLDTNLLSFFHPYFSLLPNYSPTSPSCHPISVLATDWSHDPLAGCGSYSCFQTSDDPDVRLDEDILALRKGLPERRLWFAGEHTAPFVALGTVTGAYWSGEKVAERIGKVYGREGGEEG